MRRAKFRGREETGATLVEASLVFMLLFMAIFAVIEFGLGFKNWLSVSHASREGARAGATFGSDINADINILRSVQGTLAVHGFKEGDRVRIYRANSPGPASSTMYTYRPGTGEQYEPGFEHLAGTFCDWQPCPEWGRVSYVSPIWAPASRDVSAPNTDRLGVEVLFTHNWITGFWRSTTDFTTATEFQLEPRLFEVD